MKLHVETHGHGPDLVLLHGWGMNSGVWHSVLPVLARDFRVSCVDLAGHGASSALPMPATLAAVADQVLAVTPASAAWLGWSLGGLVAMQIALQAPQRVRSLVLSNTTPRFITAPDWPDAMKPATLDAFALELTHDFVHTVHEFLALQVLGDEHARAALRILRDSVLVRGQPDRDSLATGLGILRDSDLREQLPAISAPVLVIAGAYDRLTPPKASAAMAERLTTAEFHLLARTAHAPFISHPEKFVTVLQPFLKRDDAGRDHEYAN